MTPEEAVAHALDGNAILFIGAGFSWGAENSQSHAIPSGRTLAGELLKSVGYPPTDTPLDKASAAFMRRKSKKDLVNFLTPIFTVRKVSPSHKTIASIPFRRVYTTNYDTVLEEARREQGIPFNSADGEDRPRDHLSKANLIIHINGLITRLTEKSLGSSFKLVSESYAADSFENSGWAFHFRNDIRIARAVIFIGYSMYDLDIRRAIFNEDISDKCVFVIGPLNPANELEAEDLSDLGVVAPIGVDAFAQTVQTISATHIPVVEELLIGAWDKLELPNPITALPTDGDVIDFLTRGDFNEALRVQACGPDISGYLIDRPTIETVISLIESENARIILTGELGTGKTVACEILGMLAAQRGINVFTLEGGSADEISEAEDICGLVGKKLLIIENYHRHRDLLQWLAEYAPADTSVVLTARTSAHELVEKEIFDQLGSELRIFDVTDFAPKEIAGAVDLFDRFGLWGDRAGWGPERKRSFVVRDCARQLPYLLLDALKSQHVSERFRSLISDAPNQADLEALLICAFSMEVMGFAPRISHIQELLGNSINWPRIRSQQEIKSIIDFRSSMVTARSSVLALHLLHEVFSAKLIVSTLALMAKEADERRGASEFQSILNAMMRYKNVSAVLPDANRLESTISFYERVKNLSGAKKNPQFWLQYAIASLAFGRLERAGRYFDDAYALVYPGYNTFQIDNHYARYLVEKAMETAVLNDAILLVDQAKVIILQQMRSENRFYPYRVAGVVFRFFERFRASMTPIQLEFFKRLFTEFKAQCEGIGGALRSNRYVIDCLSFSTRVVEELTV